MTSFNAIESILEATHQALLCGDFSKLSALTPQLDAALSDLRPDTDQLVLERMRHKAERNAACATAAGNGVRAAQRRLAEIRETASGLTTYDQHGLRQNDSSFGGHSRRF